MNKKQKNALDLFDEEEKEWLLDEIAIRFQVIFQPEEVHDCKTVGDIYARLLEKLETSSSAPKICYKPLAFEKLQQTLSRRAGNHKLSYETDLKGLIPETYAEPVFRKMEQDLRLSFPIPMISEAVIIVGVFMALAPLVCLALVLVISLISGIFNLGLERQYLLAYSPFLWPLIVPLLIWGPQKLPCNTLGELAEQIADTNFIKLHPLDQPFHPDVIWLALKRVVSANSAIGQEINEDTILVVS